MIEQIAEVVVNKFNSEITENAVVAKPNEELQEKQKAISAMLDAIEKGVFTNSTKDRLSKLENDKALIEEKIAIEQAHALKPLEKKTIVNFLKIYANKKFDSVRDKNDFFNNFILRVNLYDDRITIVYNTSLNPATEIYKTDNEPDNDPNGSGTTIYSKTIEKSEIGSNSDCGSGLTVNSCNQNLSGIQNNYKNKSVTENSKPTQQKSRLNHNGFKRQLLGGLLENLYSPKLLFKTGFSVCLIALSISSILSGICFFVKSLFVKLYVITTLSL